jgi:hypothetical protein
MDAATAADIVDELFLTIGSSTWLPQHGFESRSLFYLQRKGMPLDQIMTFLRHFNEAIRFKLKNAPAVDPRLLQALRRSSRFEGRDGGVEPCADGATLADG